MESVTQKAIEAVGSKQDKDWKLHPDTHAAELSAAAGPLQRILLKPELGSIIAAFNSSDAQAGGAQTRYKKLAKISAVTSFIAVVIASLLLLFPHTIGDSPSLFTIAAVAQFGLLAVSYLASIWLGYAKPYDDWMHERAKAETRRIELFNTVVAASETPQGNELPTLPLQLEYVRRYQLDVQRAYYKGRGNQHRQAAQRSGLWRIASLIILGIALLPVVGNMLNVSWLPGGLLSSGEQSQRLFLSLGLVGGALQGLWAAYGLLGQDERNAARYQDTSQNLEDLAARPLDEARAAAALGQQGPVLAFVALLHQQISSEHREWVALRSIAPDLSLDRLKVVSLPRL